MMMNKPTLSFVPGVRKSALYFSRLQNKSFQVKKGLRGGAK
jgi:hypothetical protein